MINRSEQSLLDGVRVVEVGDLGDVVVEAAARLLADLGADTIKLEPPGGAPGRDRPPLVGGTSVEFAVHNANKRAVAVDFSTDAGLATARTMLAAADICFVDRPTAVAVDVDTLIAEHPHLIVVVVSPFGRGGPRSDWQATPATLLAASGALARSGRPGDAPLLPPDEIAVATAATHAAWSAVVALTARRRSGRGQLVDLAEHEAVVTGLDPVFGAQGSAAAGRSGAVRRGRPPAGAYPIFRCADGFVRLCLLSKRQWRGMFAWLGEPAEFADPSFDSIAVRARVAERLNAAIGAAFSDCRGADLAETAASFGVPLAEVLDLGAALTNEHFVTAGAVAERTLVDGVDAVVPTGFVEVNGQRLGWRAPCPPRPTDAAGAAT